MAIGRTNCGVGGGKLFAAISVAYPQGSVLTCTCTETGEVLTAEDASGLWLFAIPYVGTWIVSATDGEQTASETVEISKEWQSVSIELDYTLWLYDAENGGDITKNTGGLTTTHSSYGTIGTSSIQFYNLKNASSAIEVIVKTTNKINFSKLSVLKLKRTKDSGWGGTAVPGNYGMVYLQVYDGSTVVSQVGVGREYASTEISLDVSSVTGEYYVRLYMKMNTGISNVVFTNVQQLWGE